MTIEWAAPAWPFIEYNGTNSGEICTAIEQFIEGSSAAVTSQGCSSVSITITYAEGFTNTYAIEVGQHFGITSGHQPGPAAWAEQWAKV
jgi:hypothetical protein